VGGAGAGACHEQTRGIASVRYAASNPTLGNLEPRSLVTYSLDREHFSFYMFIQYGSH
jgi:hypothetical protein